MLDVKTWLETTGLSVEYISYDKPPELPWVVYMEAQDCYGADMSNDIVSRSISVELYRKKSQVSAEAALESIFNAKAVAYNKNTMWLSSERCFMTVYNLTLTERK